MQDTMAMQDTMMMRDTMLTQEPTLQGSAGKGFVNRDRDQDISPFGPANEIGTRNSIY